MPEGILSRGSLLIKRNRIMQVADSDLSSAMPAAEVIDLEGFTIFPGFIDVHIHGSLGVDTMTAGAADLLRVSEFLSAKGVTGWLPTLVPGPEAEYRQALNSITASISQQRQRTGEEPAARILGVHYEGPFVNSAQCGALHRAHFRAFTSDADLDSLPTIPLAGAIQMMTLAPEIDGGIALIRELVLRGWIVSIGHTRAEVDLLDQAYEAGARHMTHFMNAMPPLHHRNPGPIGWGLSRDDVTCDIIADGVHIDPLMVRVLLKVKSCERLALISDAIAAAGSGDGDYQIWGETISVANGRTSNAAGSIAGSVITMHDAVRLMLSLGVSEIEVARMAATNPARLLGIDHDCGSIAEGKRADLVGLDQDGNVRFTMVGGFGLRT
jgi:N-acetylglucosamine-6-phosphate deacetylase